MEKPKDTILPKYKNTLFIIKSSTQTPEVGHITILNWNARLLLYKLLLLLIFPFTTLKTTYNSDTQKSTQNKGRQEVLIDTSTTTLNNECSKKRREENHMSISSLLFIAIITT